VLSAEPAPRPLPRAMEAFVVMHAFSTPAVRSVALPTLGSLHETYSLPANATCEVLLDVHASSVNPSDLHPRIARDDYPKVLGSDVAGVVLNTSGECKSLQPGDSVFGDIGANTATKAGATKELGAYAGVAVALEAQLARMPAGMDFVTAGALPKVALTTLKAYTWYAGAPGAARWHGPNTTVLVLGGSGGCGSVGIQMAKAFGAHSVITTTSAANVAYCRGLGANRVLDYHTEDWWDDSVIAPASVDVIYDTVGQPGSGNRAIPKLRSGGFYVTIAGGLATNPLPPDVGQAMFINSDTNLGSAGLMEQVGDMWQKGQITMSIDSTYSLAELPAAFAHSAEGHTVGKISVVTQAAPGGTAVGHAEA